MIKNLREIILNRIAEIIRREDYEEVYADGKRPALEELDVLNKLLMNVSETDVSQIIREKTLQKEMYIKYLTEILISQDALKLLKFQHLVVIVLTILNLYEQEKH